VPFNTQNKKSIVAVRHPDLEDTVRVYVKGAPEHIMTNCDKTFGIDGRRLGLEED